jgi:hypothetical protein
VKSGDVATVLGYVATQLHTRVEPCINGWCWGYTYKANVNNPSQLSCHASGTAIDWNAPDHPNGSSGTFTQAQRGTIYAILDEVQGSVSWLEGYDEMHFEICVDAGDLARVAAVLGDAAPPQPEGDWFDMATEDDLRRIVGEELDARLTAIAGGVWAAPVGPGYPAGEVLNTVGDRVATLLDRSAVVGRDVWAEPVGGFPAGQVLDTMSGRVATTADQVGSLYAGD